MNRSKFIRTIEVVLVILFMTACSLYAATPQPQQPQQPGQPGAPGNTSETILVDQTVTVSAGGGNAEVSFNASSGQRIQILLSASNQSMQPYGSLQYPNGSSTDNPPINTVANGVNQVEIILNQSGQYNLTVFDGSNQGGTVSVKITAMPSEPSGQQPPVQPGQPQPGQPQQPGAPGQQPGVPGPTPSGPSGQQPGAPGPTPSETTLVDQTITVSAGGGSAEVSFNASNGQTIQILLTASSHSMQPYGSLQYPNGTSTDNPPINTVANGVNKVELTLNQSGQYNLTVFDGSNRGGTVAVKITVMP